MRSIFFSTVLWSTGCWYGVMEIAGQGASSNPDYAGLMSPWHFRLS